jgi:TorA maturation chaperone TorD
VPRPHLTPENRQKLIDILVAEGCQCEDQHDEPEDATSLNCLASSALYDLEQAEKRLEESA